MPLRFSVSTFILLYVHSSASLTDSFLTASESLYKWANRNWTVFLQVTLIFIGAMLLANIGSKLFAKVLQRTIREDMYPTATDRNRRFKTLNGISAAIIHFVVWIVALLMVLERVGINTGPLLASAGIVGIALGFGAQSLVKDFVSGIFIIAENQYRVGDYVEIQNVKGRVKHISFRTTVVQDTDGTLYHIPNGSIIVTANRTMGNSKLIIDLSVTAETDVEQLEKVINKVGAEMSKSPAWSDTIAEQLKFERIKDLSGGTLTVRIIGQVKAGRQLAVKSAFYAAAQKAFKTEKIAFK